MKKKSFVIILLYSVQLFGQNSLNGLVRNSSTQEPIVGAVIYFPDLKTGTVSKLDGSYEIKNLPKTKSLVQVKMLGYKTFVKLINLSTTSNFDVDMEESVVEEEEIVITGTSYATEIKRSPVPMITIDQKFLSQNLSSNVIDAMVKIPGISALSTGPNVSKPFIRGLGYNRILTLFDGVRQDGQQWGDEHGIEVDQNLVDRIEVIKGPASLIYGSDALAGVVNLLPENTLPIGALKGTFMTSYQTNNKQISSSLNLAGNQKGYVWGIRVSQKQASCYQNQIDKRVYGTRFKENDVNAYLGINKSWGYSHINFSMFDNLQEIPDGTRDSVSRLFTKQISEEDTLRPIVSHKDLETYNINLIHQHVQHFRVYSASNVFFGRSKLAFKLGFQQSRRREYGHPKFANLPGLSLNLNSYTYDVKYSFPQYFGFEILTGINGMYQQNTNSNATEFVIPNYNAFDIGPFIFIKREFGKTDFAFGLRYDTRLFENNALFTKPNSSNGFDEETGFNANDTLITKQFDAYKHQFSGLSGSIGATYNLNGHFSIKANIARGYRAPNITEIAAKGVHPGTGFQQLGDANFKPEFSLQEDLGLFFDYEHVSGSLEVFHNLIDNYIYNEKLLSALGGDSIYSQSGTNYQVYKFHQTKAQLYGGEFSLDFHPHPLDWLHFENTASVVYAVNQGAKGVVITDSTRYLPFIPPFHTNSELRADVKKQVFCFASVYAKIGCQYFASQDKIFSAYGTETPTPGYVLFDAGIGTDIVNRKHKVLLKISVMVNNLTDVAYQSNLSRLKYMDNYPVNGTGRSGIYNMGRNIGVKLIAPIMIK